MISNLPLHTAAKNNHIECLIFLIKAGADLNAIDNKCGYTPLHWASVSGHQDCVIELIKAGADTDAKDKDNNTPSDLSIYADTDCVKY